MMSAAMLNNIERHVARFYHLAVRAACRVPASSLAEQDDQFIRQVLRTSEAFTCARVWLDREKPHPDDILDLGLILTRSLDHWNRVRARWFGNPAQAALAAAATELADAADALQEAIVSAPWFENSASGGIATAAVPRKVQ